MRRSSRLKPELSIAFELPPWQSARIDCAADDLADTECKLALVRPLDEQSDDSMSFAT
jgi:hypothetical protein